MAEGTKNSMTALSEIIQFIEKKSGTKSIRPDMDIFATLRITGDDCSEIIEEYTERYKVDMSNYIWYFHHEEEGFNFGAYFFKSPNKRVERIPITPNILAESAKAKKWIIEYPNHEIPEKRYDIIFMETIFFTIFFLLCLGWLLPLIF